MAKRSNSHFIFLLHFEIGLLLYFSMYGITAQMVQVNPFINPANELKFQKLDVNDGLSQNQVTFILQDELDFLWIGTAGGLNRFDGNEMRSYTKIEGLKKQPVYFYSAIKNLDNTFWIATDLGFLYFDPVSLSGKMYSSKDLPPSGGTLHNIIRLPDKTFLASLTDKGVLSFNPETGAIKVVLSFKQKNGIAQDEDIVGVVVDKDNKALLITSLRIYAYLPDVANEIVSFPIGSKAQCIWNNVANDQILIGTSSGIYTYEKGRLDEFSEMNLAFSDSRQSSITAIFRDSNGAFWLGAPNAVHQYRPAEKRMQSYAHNPEIEESIGSGLTQFFYEDKSKNLWISIAEQGIYKIDLKQKRFFSIANQRGQPAQLVSPLTFDCYEQPVTGNLMITCDGLSEIDLASQTVTLSKHDPASPGSGFLKNARKIFYINDSSYFILADKRIFEVNSKTKSGKVVIVNGRQVNHVQRAFLLKNKTILCTGKDSIYIIDPIRSTLIQKLLPSMSFTDIPLPEITSVVESSDGTIWIGSIRGLMAYNPEINEFENNTDSLINLKLSNPCVTSIAFENDDILWIGTVSGLYMWNFKLKTLKAYTTDQGLSDNKIWSIAIDQRKTLWVSSNKGLMNIEKSADDLKIHQYTIHDGLPSNEFAMSAVTKGTSGNYYFGTTNGLLYFNPDSISMIKPISSKIVITGLNVYGTPLFKTPDIAYQNEVTLPYDSKVFSLVYSSLDFTDPKRNLYRYKLEGYDQQWVDAGNRKEAFYTNLPPGNYTFLVEASTVDRQWVGAKKSILVTIPPPFWMTWWFKTVLLLMGISLLWALIRFVERRKIQKKLAELERQQTLELERMRISKDMHDEVGSSLTKIAILSELASRDIVNSEMHLGKIRNFSREVIGSMSQIIWAINPENDKLDSLVAYMRAFISETLEQANIAYTIDFPDQLPSQEIPTDFRRNIFLTLKEAIHNVLKHSQANHVQIRLITGQNKLEFTLKDNGVGFSKDVPTLGNGLQNMKKRIEEMGGKLQINSDQGAGTELIFDVVILWKIP